VVRDQTELSRRQDESPQASVEGNLANRPLCPRLFPLPERLCLFCRAEDAPPLEHPTFKKQANFLTSQGCREVLPFAAPHYRRSSVLDKVGCTSGGGYGDCEVFKNLEKLMLRELLLGGKIPKGARRALWSLIKSYLCGCIYPSEQ